MKCINCGKQLKKVHDPNVTFSKNATYMGICTNEDCKSKGLSVAVGEHKGDVTKKTNQKKIK